MKNKINKGSTQKLQVEVDIMEQRISGLKQILQYQKEQQKERNISSQGSTRWSAASTNIPLKNYGKHVLEKHRQQKMQQKNKSRPSSRSSSLSKQTQQTQQTSEQQQQQQTFLSQSLNINKNNANENLKKALIIQQQYSNEVIKFLNQIGLEQYSTILLDNGFDEMDLLKEIQIEHFKDMKIPPLDARKILNKIQKLNEEQQQQQLHTQQQIQKLKESQQQQQNIDNDDIYNEEEQHRLFLEAVLQYRQSKQQSTQINEQQIQEEEEEDDQQYGAISSRQNKKEDQQRNKMKFLLTGSQDWVMFNLDYDQNQGTDKQQIIIDKISCFQCYKLFDQKYAKIVNNNQFCSNQCLEQYNLQNIYLCRSQSCSKQINIEQAYYDIGQWFCNQECFKQYQWESVNIRGRTNISL